MQVTKRFLAACAAILVAQAALLRLFGQPWICTCGYTKLWEGDVTSSGLSQHLFDWYSFSHVIHGVLFYFALRYLFPRMSVWARLLIALSLESAWEVLENTPMVIEHYRQQALAHGYVGDSVLNSLSDTFCMIAGFVFASWARTALSVALVLALEILTILMIRDSLALNILNLIHVFPAIAAWQSGAL
ncbi:MAG: DUF2585 family protein [Candidatus Kaiserbacteria bacterium]|nr:DUF2585 family protein [Candidatus Kaiserbacteria bacterium]